MPGLTDEQRLLRDTVRDLADDKIAPRAAEIDRTAEFPWDVKELLAEHELFTLHFPERLGGFGGDLLTACLAIEQISRVCATSGLILAVQGLGAVPILLAGTEEQQQRWIPDLAAGTTLIAFAITEAEAGSDAAAIRTRAVRDGDEYVISGCSRASSSRPTGPGSGSRDSSTRWGSAAPPPPSSPSTTCASRPATSWAPRATGSRSP